MIDPQFVEFAPSADHNNVVNGVPVVTRYDLSFYAVGSSQPLEVVNVGKPAPDASGKIHVSFFPSWPTPGQVYEARVTAVGKNSATSTVSNRFSFSGLCNYVLSASSLAFAAGGGNGSVGVLTLASCSWNGTSSASWLTVTGGTTTGNGTLSVVAAANTSSNSRTATLTIQGQDVSVTQAGASSCTGSLSASNASAPSQGLSGQVNVSVANGCTWTASSPVSWISVSPASSGGSGPASYNVQPNNTTSTRSATLMIAGKPLAISQSAGQTSTSTQCGHLSATSANAPGSGSSGYFYINEAAGCNWTASSAASWVSVTPTSGLGAKRIDWTVAANNTSSARNTTLTVGGNIFNIAQAAGTASCAPVVNASGINAPVSGAKGSASVTAPAGCSWTASSSASWLTVTPGSGSGNGSVTWTVAANTGAARNALLKIDRFEYSVSQAGVACAPSVTQSSISAAAAGASGAVAVSAAGCTWTTSSPVSWVTVTPASGSGTSNASYTVLPNTGSSSRSTTIVVAGKSIAVSQAGAACAPVVSANGINAPASGASGTATVTAPSGCSWTASSQASWLTVTPGTASGNRTVSWSVAPNTGAARSTVLKIDRYEFGVSQAGVSCAPSIAQSSVNAGAAGMTGSIGVSAGGGCGWSASSPVSWITLGSTSGSGNGSVAFTVKPNTQTSVRSATLLIAGKPVLVSQAAAACNPTVSTGSLNLGSPSQSGQVSVTANCAWTASSPVSWITVTPGSGSSNGSVTYNVAANTSSSQRSTTLTIAGKSVSVTQSGQSTSSACNYTLPSGSSVTRVATTVNVNVTTTSSCSWTATSNASWITVNAPTGSKKGSGKVSFDASMNWTNKTRTGTVTIAGKTYTVTQGG